MKVGNCSVCARRDALLRRPDRPHIRSFSAQRTTLNTWARSVHGTPVTQSRAAETSLCVDRPLAAAELVNSLVSEAHARYKSNTDGENSQVYPALARVPSDLFGVCVVGTSGNVYAVGDTDYEFSIMSVSKPFVFALVCQVIGAEQAREKLGANSTGLPFNSLVGHRTQRGRSNEPDGECRRHRDDQPRAGRDRRRQMAVHPRRVCPGLPAASCR